MGLAIYPHLTSIVSMAYSGPSAVDTRRLILVEISCFASLRIPACSSQAHWIWFSAVQNWFWHRGFEFSSTFAEMV
jgi:hypothetical protein